MASPSNALLSRLNAAAALHRSGQLEQAEQLYRALLHDVPDQPDGWHLLGVLQHRRGLLADAETMIRKAIGLREQPVFLVNLGKVLLETGRSEEALALVRRALVLHPDERDALYLLADMAARRGDGAEAVQLARRLCASHPGAPALTLLGSSLLAAGDAEASAQAYTQALELQPRDPHALNNLAGALGRCGRSKEAQAAMRQALQIDPGYVQGWHNLGVLHEREERLEDALAAYANAHRLNPAAIGTARQMAALHLRLQDEDSTARLLLGSQGWGTEDLTLHLSLALVLDMRGRCEEAERVLRQALRIDPDFRDARLNLGLLLLRMGRMDEGWALYESRISDADDLKAAFKLPVLPFPQWQGEPLHGKSILVHAEQGYGDVVQFVRYCAVLKELGAARVRVASFIPLRELIATAPGVDAVVCEGDPLRVDDYWVLALSIPSVVGTRLDTIPARIPYLRALPGRIKAWQARLPQGPLKVGLAWRGSTMHKNDANRSLGSLAMLAPLWSVPAARFVSLQMGEAAEQARTPAPGQPLVHLGDDIQDFADAAAIVAQLDLLICVDTALAHVAGALGKPCWVLLPAIGTDWRWLTGRSDSPWYPGVLRLFRQREPNAWEPLLQEVAAELGRFAPQPRTIRGNVFPGGRPPAPALTPAAQAQALFRQGLESHQAGRLEQAEAAYQRAVELDPELAAAHANLAVLFSLSRRFAQAETACRKAIALDPSNADCYNNLGNLLTHSGQPAQAQEAFERALVLRPQYAAAHNNLGNLLLNQNQPAQAEAAFRTAIALRPEFSAAWCNLGDVLRSGLRFAEAEQALRHAIALQPDSVNGWINLGRVLKDTRRWREAEAACRRAMELDPAHVQARLNLALLLLTLDEYAEGWALNEVRSAPGRERSSTRPPDVPWPPWSGQPLAGKSLMLWPEQGHGDYIQFIRFAALLKRQGLARLTVVCPAAMAPLLRTAPGVDAVAPDARKLPPHDYWAFPMSLPLHLGTTLRSIPARLPYLRATADRIARWKPRLPADGRRVGLAWKGSPGHRNDGNRSMASLSDMAPLWSAQQVRFVSLQKGAGQDEAIEPPPGQPLVALGHEIADFADLAAIVSQLDLVICVDTAVAHVAGALGKPCWIVLPAIGSDWRWGIGRDDCPWYPGAVRLFRQRTPGDWSAVLAEVAQALATFSPDTVATAMRTVRGNLLLGEPGALPAADPAQQQLREGTRLQQAGQGEAAQAAFRRAIALKPGYAAAHLRLASALSGAGDAAQAQAACRAAIAADPSCAEAFNDLGLLLAAEGRQQQAEAAYRQALALRDDLGVAHNNLARLLAEDGRLDQALQAGRRAAALLPGDAVIQSNLGDLLRRSGHYDEAAPLLRRALDLQPRSVQAWINLGALEQNLRNWPQAEAAWRRALALEPGHVQARLNLGHLLLALGRYREGWALCEARFAPGRPHAGTRPPPVAWPRWQGEPLQGRSLLLWPEQGHGDSLQFLRYVAMLRQRGVARLTVVCSPPLQRLLRSLDGIDAVATSVEGLAPHDFWSFLLSLPLHLDTTVDAIPCALPYLRADPQDVARWKPELPATGLKVGLVWKGSPAHANDLRRSLPCLATLAPLWSAREGLQFIALQKGAGEDEALAPPPGQPLLALGARIRDFADTAAIVSQLDLVICVDTAVAHLAGALGKPCWVMLPWIADWRWLLDRTDSPWYPGQLRLFRQPQRGDWDAVVAQVGAALAQFATDAADHRVHNNLGNLLLAGRRLDEAEAAYRRALQIRPGHPNALHNLANVLRMTGRPALAEPLLRQALEQEPQLPDAWVNMGATLADLGRPLEAQEAYRRAIALAPQHAQGHVNLGFLLLSLGRLSEGWPLVEARHWPQVPGPQSRAPQLAWPQWQGEPLAGRSLVVWPEQGLGDCIQFARFAITLKQRGLRHLTLVCPAPLLPLLRTVALVDAVLTPQDALPEHDFWAFMMSLPLHLGTTLANVPAQLPYVHADSGRVQKLRPHLPTGIRVGLVWKGSPSHDNDAQRSLPGLACFAPLWRVAGISFLSLQQDFGQQEMASLPPDQPLLALGPTLRDFADTAAVVDQLDLVICVDTAIAHLAGAMGKPCWVLLAATATDWRWLREREDSPWYPGVLRLFRQHAAGDWAELMERVEAALRSWAAGRRHDAPPVVHAGAVPQDGKLAIRLPPDDQAGAIYREGVALHNSGQPEQAEACYRRALQLRPGYAAAHNNLGVLLQARRQWTEAEASYRQAIALGHEGAAAHNNLGNLLADTQRLPQAEASFREALRAEDTAAAHNNLGNLLLETGRVEPAQQAFERAIALRPDDAGAHVNLGNLLCRLQRWDQAHAMLQRAITLAPSAGAFINLGVLHRHQHQWAQAEAAYRNALALEPDNASARMNLGFLLLATGRFAQGWPLHEARYAPQRQQSDSKPPRVSWPQWQGEPLQGTSMVLWPEQGHGDWIQFVRFVPQLRARGVRQLTIVCPAILQRLLQAVPGVDAVVTELSALTPHDYWCFPLSLPLHLGTTLDNLPAQLPYLQADPRWIDCWADRLPAGRKAGLVWKGAAAHKNDANRSLPGLAALAPLWQVPGWQFMSLQKGAGEDEARQPPPGQSLLALGDALQDFADTAAVISQLDLVICVDTAVAHLAGALGKPVWVLLPDVGSDWRWMLQRSDSPWYPQVMRLFRQQRPGDWTGPVAQMAQALAAWPQALAPAPADASAWNNAGVEAMALGRNDEAEAALRRAIDLKPVHAGAHLNLGTLLRKQRRWDEAEQAYQAAARLSPDKVDGPLNLAALLHALGRLAPAQQAYQQVLVLEPGNAQAQCGLAMLYLAQGRFKEGWPLFEARERAWDKLSPAQPPPTAGLRWEGQALAGRSIVVWHEQGLGDAIQFVRYAALLKARGAARVTVASPRPLQELLATAPGVDHVQALSAALPPQDFWCYTLDLPHRLHTQLDTIPAHLPYLAADPDRVAHWAARLPARPQRRVGLVWKGAPGHTNDRERSLPGLATLAPLWQAGPPAFISLQKAAGEQEALAPPAGQPLLALGHEVRDFADLAAIVSQLDLVICVDTALAHLAGALGKPVWVLLPAVSTDWRWLRDRADSPWYPGVMRLFRQSQGQDWEPVVASVAAALQEFGATAEPAKPAAARPRKARKPGAG